MSSNRNSPYGKVDLIKFCVINSKGEVTNVECKTKLSVDRIKLSALTNFIGDQVAAFKTIDHYRIVSIPKKRVLTCASTIRDADLTSGETLLLLKNYSVEGVPLGCGNEPSSEGPSINSILEATRCNLPKNHQFHVKEIDVIDQFERDSRPIFVTLIDYTSTILQKNSKFEMFLKDLKPFDLEHLDNGNVRRKRKNDSTGDREEEYDVETLKQLTEMGFSIDRSKRALRMSNMSPTEAMDWLMAFGLSSSSCIQPFVNPTTSDQMSPLITQIYPKVPAVIECVNKYYRRNFVPLESLFTDLKNLGFDDDEILDAMWRFQNNQNLTTEWLINGNRPRLNDLCRGLTYDHPLIKEILNSPYFITNLIKPNIFLAVVSLAEHLDPRELLMDDEIALFLQELYQLYHSLQNIHDDNGTHVSGDDQ